MKNQLFDKIFGCIAGSCIGSAMGSPVEGWPKERIIEEYGVLDKLLPYTHYDKNDKGGGRMRLAGTTEDGIERQKLMCTAIIEKKRRITPQELAEIWVRDINPDNFGVQMQPTDATMYRLMVAGEGFEVAGYHRIGHYSFFPATEVGRFSVAPGTIAFARSCQPIGVINAFDPWQAAQDAMEIGKMYMASNDVGLFWSASVASAIAEALKPDSSVDSVLVAAQNSVPKQIWAEIKEAISLSEKVENAIDMRVPFDLKYNNTVGFNPLSKAHEIVSKAFAIFHKTKGDSENALIAAVNFGRDTDCLAAVVGGLTGALTGTKTIPSDWISTVDEATLANRYTVSNLTLEQTCEGLYQALEAQLNFQRDRLGLFAHSTKKGDGKKS